MRPLSDTQQIHDQLLILGNLVGGSAVQRRDLLDTQGVLIDMIDTQGAGHANGI